jgi:hypothetical protein
MKNLAVTAFFVMCVTSHAKITQYSPQEDAARVGPLPILAWHYNGTAEAFSVYVGQDKDELCTCTAIQEDFNNDGKVDYGDLTAYADIVKKNGGGILKQWAKVAGAKSAVNAIMLPNPPANGKDAEQYCFVKTEMLTPGQTYYWRVDMIAGDSVSKGSVRQLTATHTGVSEDVTAVQRNPDMGWVLQECYPIRKKDGSLYITPNYDYPGVDNVMLTCSWADLEDSINDYNFIDIDYAYDYWKKRGKDMQLRISTEPWGWWSDSKRGLGIPQYVIDALTDAERQTQKTYVGKDYTLVDARNVFYQERLLAFLKTLAKHFSIESGRPVDLVDLLGYGVWGEWHTGFTYPNVEERKKALRKIIDIWVEAFGDRILAISYTHDPQGPLELGKGPTTHYDEASTDTYAEYLAYSAFDYALTKPSVTFRRNGCAGTVTSNERKLCEEFFKRPNSWLQVSELAGGYTDFKYPADWCAFKNIKVAIDDLLSLHPNYITIPSWDGQRARNFIQERPDMVSYGLIRMGYRYVPQTIYYPAKVKNKDSFTLGIDWMNRGVGKAVQNFDLNCVLRTMDGQFVSKQALGRLENRLWLKGAVYKSAHHVHMFVGQKGQYKLYIEMIDPRDGRQIRMPLYDMFDGMYLAGLIEVED